MLAHVKVDAQKPGLNLSITKLQKADHANIKTDLIWLCAGSNIRTCILSEFTVFVDKGHDNPSSY